MERTDRDIIEKFKEYGDSPESMTAMADILVFMGIPEAVDFLKIAQEELEDFQDYKKQLRQEYYDYIGQGSRYYMSFEQFAVKRERGEI